MLKKRNKELMTLEKYRKIFTFPVKEYYEKAGFDFSKEDFEKPAIEFIDIYTEKLVGAPLFENTEVVLDFFKQKDFFQYIISAMEQKSLVKSVEERNIDWSWPAEKMSCLIRALSPFPGAECKILFNSGIKRLKIKKSKVVDYKGKIGEVLSFEKDRFIVACKEKALLLSQVQLEGKKTMSAEEFIRGIKEKIFVIIS